MPIEFDKLTKNEKDDIQWASFTSSLSDNKNSNRYAKLDDDVVSKWSGIPIKIINAIKVDFDTVLSSVNSFDGRLSKIFGNEAVELERYAEFLEIGQDLMDVVKKFDIKLKEHTNSLETYMQQLATQAQKIQEHTQKLEEHDIALQDAGAKFGVCTLEDLD